MSGSAFDARHELDPTRPHNRESLVWVFTDPEARIALVGYTWVDPHGVAGAAGIAFGSGLEAPVFHREDGIPVPASTSFEHFAAGPIEVRHDGPDRVAHVTYRSPDYALDVTFEPMGTPYAYSSHPEPFPRFFADDRIEQGGVVRGTATVGGRHFELDGFGQRDHAWGARDWGSTLHYKWLNFLGPDVSVHVQDVHGLGRNDVRGYVHKDGLTSPVVRTTMTYDLDERLVHRGLVVELEDEAGRRTRAAMVEDGDDFAYPIDPRLTLVDVLGHCEVDGVPGAAYVEMAWPPEYLEHRAAALGGKPPS